MTDPQATVARRPDADGASEADDGANGADDGADTGAGADADAGADAGAGADTDAGADAADLTGAGAVAAALSRAGVECLFGVQGGAIMPVYDAIRETDLRHVTMAHEQGAAHAADAYGVVSGAPGVCIATSGPGATNLVTGIADANMDSDPVVALTGQVPTDLVGNNAFQETDTTGVTTPVTKANYFAGDPDEAGDAVGEAVALAAAGRPGPTLVDLPKDVTRAPAREPGDPATPPGYDPPERADPGAVRAAARAIEDAARPLVLAGGGVAKSGASEELRTFADRVEAPVATTMPAVGTYPEDRDRALGMAGMHGTGYANMAVTHCDLLLAVGCRFDDRLTGNVETFAPGATVVHVDVDAAEISKNVHADHALVGDAAAVLDQLNDAVGAAPDADDWLARVADWKATYPMDYETPEDEPLKPQFVVEALDEATPDDAVVTTGVGQHQMWAVQYWTFTRPRTWVSSHGLGAMGYGLPAAIGAAVAADDGREVVCIEGDGSLLMTVQELAVAVREGIDLTVAVLNNRYIGMVRQWQDAFYGGRRTAADYGWCPAFDELAEAFGAAGFRVDGYDEVAETIEAARAHDGPAVVDFHVDPAEDVYPMVPSGGDNGRFALAEDQL